RRWTDSAEPCQRRPIEIELTPDIAEVLRRLHRPTPSRSVPPPGARRSPRPAARREARAVLREARSVRRATCAADPRRRALWAPGDVRCGPMAPLLCDACGAVDATCPVVRAFADPQMHERRDLYLARQPPGSRLAPAWLPPGSRLAPARYLAWRAARYPARHPARSEERRVGQ